MNTNCKTNAIFNIEGILSIAPELIPLLQAHYDELTLNKDSVQLDPDWVRYAAMEEAGKFFVFTARVDGVLVGYSAFFVDQHLHYSDLRVGHNDVLYVTPPMRRAGVGLDLILYSEDQLELLEVQKIVWHVKFDKFVNGVRHQHDFRPLLHRLGYSDEETVVGKIT